MSSSVVASRGTTEFPSALGARLQWLGQGFLLLLALVLPFEVPLFRLGMLQITTVELVLYAMLAVWLASTLAGRRLSTLPNLVATLLAAPQARAAALLAVVMFVSAAAAPSHRAAAVKFALRSLSGILVFFAARALTRPGSVRRVLLAVVVGALLSATTAVVDRLAPDTSVIWNHFREGNFVTLGLIRSSGVFAYPTIGAMYWEAAAPLLMVIPLLKADGATPKLGATGDLIRVVLGSALLVLAILASATRSALVGMALACVALLVLAWRSPSGARRTAAAALAVTVTLGLGASVFGPLLGQRMLWWRDESWYRAEYQVSATPRSVQPGELFSVSVTLRNTGVLLWGRTRPGLTHLSYHWERLDGGITTLSYFEGRRTELPSDVPSGGVVDVLGIVQGPATPGRYRLSWDLVREDVCWFSEQGNPTASQVVVVVENSGDTKPEAPLNDPPGPIFNPPQPRRIELWRAAVVLWRERPLLGIGPDNFRRRYEAVLGTAPTGQPYTDTRLHANSLYFETLADLGLAGIVAVALIGVALLRSLRRHWATGCVAGLGCAVAAGTFFVHGAFDYFFEFTPLLTLFWLLLGLTEASTSETSAAARASTP
jgi:hypothetical protein